jgi:hypothetical protein
MKIKNPNILINIILGNLLAEKEGLELFLRNTQNPLKTAKNLKFISFFLNI